jgi:Predicted phosphatase homologous to the C-terminal domain of histone macroH2A1
MHIELIQADITTLNVDAIVNAANSYLQHGGGVAGAISRKGGPVIQRESDRIGFVPVGNAAVTSAGALPCRYVIHAVGPRMGEGDEDRKLRDATIAALERAEELKIGSIALPAISTGIFGYPIERCARVMSQAVKDFQPRAKSLTRIVICLFDREALSVFDAAYREIFS